MLKYKKLAPVFSVQFFTWSGLFSIWIYTTPVIKKNFCTSLNSFDLNFKNDRKRVGICLALYSILGAVLTFILHKLLKKSSKYAVQATALLFGASGIRLMTFLHSKYLLLFSFAFITAWCNINTTPYLLVGKIAPEEESEKIYTVFNFSTISPQAIAAFFLMFVTKNYVKGNMMDTFFLDGILMLIGAGISLLIYFKQSKFNPEFND